MRKALLSILLLLGPTTLPHIAAAATPPAVAIPGSEQRTLHGTAIKVDYKLYVGLPADYQTSGKKYPVVYLLDADYSFAIARNIVDHLSERGHLPQVIVVGIAYDGPPAYRLNRTRDYTPSHSLQGGYGPEYQAVSGGGPAFRQFLAADLFPFVQKEYRATEDRYFVGHSYGGLFASWLAVTSPELFKGFVIVSPSLWYDEGIIFREEAKAAKRRKDLSLRIYLGVGDREINSENNMPADLRRFAAVLESRAYKGLSLRAEVAADETHNSIFPRALSNGLRFVLEGR